MLRTIGPIKRYPITVPKSNAFQYATPEHQIKLHTLMLAIGKRGAGKTVAITSMLKNLQRDKVLDRLFLITPTWESNKEAFRGLPIDEQDVFHDPDDLSALDEIIKRVEQEGKDLEEYKNKVRVKRKMEAAMKQMKSDDDVDNIDPDLLLNALYNGVLDQAEPEHRWKGRAPICILFVDDSVGSRLLDSRKFLNFCLKHRHIGGGLGVSVIVASQAYTTQQGGIPKSLRGTTFVHSFTMALKHFMVERDGQKFRVSMNKADADRWGNNLYVCPLLGVYHCGPRNMVPLSRRVTGARKDQFVVHKDGNNLNCISHNLIVYNNNAYWETYLRTCYPPPPPRQYHPHDRLPHQERNCAQKDGRRDVGPCDGGHIPPGVRLCDGGRSSQFLICRHGPQRPYQEIPPKFRHLYHNP